MDEKGNIKLYFSLAEDLIIWYKNIKEVYGNLDNFLVLLSVANFHKKEITEGVEGSPNIDDQELTSKSIVARIPKEKGVSINGIVRETGIPRTSVKRIIDQYVEKEVFKKNPKGLITIGANYRSNNKNRRIASYHFFQQVVKKTKAHNLKIAEE
jgi:hypothetical protein